MKAPFGLIFVFVVIMFLAGCVDENVSDNGSSGSGIVGFKDLLPAEIAALAEDFYPAGWTRQSILDKLPEAVNKTGNMEFDEWSGVVLITGDMHIVDLTIQPGTIVFISANSDDQHDGWTSTVDPVNPHEFFGENYSYEHVFIQVSGELVARGTADEPIIITSTSSDPWLADWEKIVFERGVLEYAVVEYGSGMAIESSDVTISHCLIRDMLSQGVMFGTWPEAGMTGESISPNITCNYMYNFGHMAVQSFFSEPHIFNNIFIHKYTKDPELYDYLNLGENGGLDIHGGNGTIEYNFISYGYNVDMEKESQLGGPGIGICEATAPEICFNTIVGNKWGIELQGGMPRVNNNNIYNNQKGDLIVRTVYSEPGRESEVMVYKRPLDFKNNYWGVGEEDSVISKMNIGNGVEVSANPISTSLVQSAGPDWSEFEWFYS